jgi:hypothetical protein
MQTATTSTQAVAGKRGDTASAGSIKMQKRIGSIVYEVEIHFAPDAKETFNDKILRLMRRDLEAAS